MSQTVRGEERSDLFLDTTFVHGNNDASNNIGKDGWKKPAVCSLCTNTLFS